MKEIAPSKRLEHLLARFYRAGGVVDYVLLDAPELAWSPASADLHRLSADAAMHVLGQRNRQGIFSETDRLHINQPLKHLTWDVAKAVAQEIEWQEFIGRAKSPHGSYLYPQGCLPQDAGIFGYALAFLSPPYGLRLPWLKAVWLFEAVNHELGLKPHEGSEIVQWSSNWSNYFDDGNEWWGGFFWTVRTGNRVLCIAASSTD